MRPYPLATGALILFVALAAAAPSAREPKEPLALLVDQVGGATFQPPHARREMPVKGIVPIDAATRVKVPPGGAVSLICANESVSEIRHETLVTAESCRTGAKLPDGSFDDLRLRVLGRSLELVGEARGELDGSVPVLLRPRNTKLLDRRPTLRWIAPADARRYEVSIAGKSRHGRIVEEGDLTCSRERIAGVDVRVCSWPWPAGWPDLGAGAYAVLLQAQLGAEGRWMEDPGTIRFQVLDGDEAASIQARLDALRRIPIDAMTRDLLLAGLYGKESVFADAMELYRLAASTMDSPELEVTMGELFQASGLPGFALAYYRQASSRGAGSAAQAAAELRWGRLLARDGARQEALAHLERAATIYKQLGLGDEEKVVRQEIKALRRR